MKTFQIRNVWNYLREFKRDIKEDAVTTGTGFKFSFRQWFTHILQAGDRTGSHGRPDLPVSILRPVNIAITTVLWIFLSTTLDSRD